jgi:hypothetical protein
VESTHGQTKVRPSEETMNLPPAKEVIESVKSLQAMLLQHSEAHLALIHALRKHRGMLTPKVVP